jgi:hypothetical protein
MTSVDFMGADVVEFVRANGGDVVWAISAIFSVKRRRDGAGFAVPIRWEPTSLVITTTSVCWTQGVERRTGLFKNKLELDQRFETVRLSEINNCYVGKEDLAGQTYGLVCGDVFMTRMLPVLQEAVDALRSVGRAVEVRHDLAIR